MKSGFQRCFSGIALGVAYLMAGGAMGAEVTCASHKAVFDESRKGALVALTTKAGIPFLTGRPVGLFTVAARREDAFTNRCAVTAAQAKFFSCEPVPDGVRLVYTGFDSPAIEEVVCTVRGGAGDDRLRWRLAAAVKPGWVLCETTYPQLTLTGSIGPSAADDALLTGASFSNGLRRNLAKGFSVDARQPGYLAVQMACYYDPRALLLYACEDPKGEAKRLHGWWNDKTADLQLQYTRFGWDRGRIESPYDVVTATIDSPSGTLTWHDGADLYKKWAIRQRWCRTPWKYRTDIPAWLRGKAAYSDMGSRWRGWMDRPGSLVRWARDYFAKQYPGAVVAVHFDGWERNGVYNMTHYFPLYPTDAAYADFATEARKYGFLAFPWPSGTRRSDAFDRRPDGTFAVDERAAFVRDFLPHACLKPDGSRQLCSCGWLRGGQVSYMCPGDPWTVRWFARDIAGELAKRGTPCISGDQNIGGAATECWNPAHGHTPGSGVWMTDSARAMSFAALAALRERFPEAAFCYEEPNEHVNDTVTFNNVREAYRAEVEWTGLFNYLYHEFAPIFPLGGKGVYGQAYQAAMGLMPVVRVTEGDVDHESLILPNGSFENLTADGEAVGWSNGARERPNGLDSAEHHSGRYAMRIERHAGTNKWDHVATNLAHEDSAFTPGRRYRFSAWMKVEKGSFWIDFGLFGVQKSVGWARVASGKAGDGWVRAETEFVYPKDEISMVRLMVNAAPDTRGWLDDVKLELVEASGGTRPLTYEGSRSRDAWQKRTIDLWGVEGREWLAYGRREKPPVLECGTITYFKREVPAVCVAAYASPEGQHALVLANGTAVNQPVAWTDAAGRHALTLGPREVRIVR